MRSLLESLNRTLGEREYARDPNGRFAKVPAYRKLGAKQKAFNNELETKAKDLEDKLASMGPLDPKRDAVEREARVLRAARRWAPPIVMGDGDSFTFRLNYGSASDPGYNDPVYNDAMKLWKDWGKKLKVGFR